MKKLQQSDFDVLHYNLPAESSSHYSDKAISILRNFQKEHLPYFLSSDIVLTLSGVRAFDTYITFEGLESSTVSQFRHILAKEGLTLASETSEYEDPVDFYYLVNHDALQAIPTQYAFKGWFNPNPPYTIERMHDWTYHIERTLNNLMADEKLPKAWLADHLSAHNIRFGILLGYPGEAIACGCWMDVLGEKQMPGARSSAIAYHDAYDAAWPTYYFTDAVAGNANIQAHQQLWSEILTEVYESHWHLALSNDKDFKDAAASIRELKNT
jgi:hypothetical protein